MLWWIITIGSLILCTIILFIHIKREWLDDHIIELFVGMTATIIGVTLAITLTNFDTKEKEKTQVLGVLETTYRDVWRARAEKNVPFQSSDLNSLISVLNSFPLRIPYSIEFLITNEICNKVMNSTSLITLHDSLFGIKNFSERICNYEQLEEEQLNTMLESPIFIKIMHDRLLIDNSYEIAIRTLYISNEYLNKRIDKNEFEILHRIIGELSLMRTYSYLDREFDENEIAPFYISALKDEKLKKLVKRLKAPPYQTLDPNEYDVYYMDTLIQLDIDIEDYCEEYGWVFIPYDN